MRTIEELRNLVRIRDRTNERILDSIRETLDWEFGASSDPGELLSRSWRHNRVSLSVAFSHHSEIGPAWLGNASHYGSFAEEFSDDPRSACKAALHSLGKLTPIPEEDIAALMERLRLPSEGNPRISIGECVNLSPEEDEFLRMWINLDYKDIPDIAKSLARIEAEVVGCLNGPGEYEASLSGAIAIGILIGKRMSSGRTSHV